MPYRRNLRRAFALRCQRCDGPARALYVRKVAYERGEGSRALGWTRVGTVYLSCNQVDLWEEALPPPSDY